MRFLLGSLLLLAACLKSAPVAAPVAAPTLFDHEGRYVYVVDNITRDASVAGPSAVRLWVSLPVDRPEQHVAIQEIDPMPTRFYDDPASGNKVAFWAIPDPPEKGRLTFSVRFHVFGWPIPATVDATRVTRADPASPEVQRYTISEPWLEQSPEIAARAKAIVGTEANPYLQARLVFDAVVKDMTYDYPSMQDRGVTRAFAQQKGDCGEFSHVFIAMMRSLGVPARSVVCNWPDSGGHAWAEVFLPPYGWVPFDTSGAQLVLNGLKGQMPDEKIDGFVKKTGMVGRDPYALAGGLYPNRLIVFIGENLKIEGTEFGERTFRFLQPGGLGAWPPAAEMVGLGKGTVQAGFYLWDKEVDDPVVLEKRIGIAMGPAYLTANLPDRAIPGLEAKLEQDPDDATTWFQLGQARFKTHKLPEARDALQRSIAGKGGSTKRTTDTWAHIFLGMIADLGGDREGAKKEYQAAIDMGADYSGSLALAKKLMEEGYRE